ncbi:hypothetical protein HHK36_000079 [Tetracentron sinense]|uniref:Non-specific lipid-transfer protein n=1 Tax=Tetracentron sinense TaxID=13715 RepID=A0A835DPP9_TETSI|nr:hypothetical protein HHK36_000079 [Tetracentron sinense]
MTRTVGFLAILLLVSGSAMGAPSCMVVMQNLTPCLAYLRGSGSGPSKACCNGVTAVGKVSKGKGDRQAICMCLKNVAFSFGNIDTSRISSLPKKCRVQIQLPPISANIDCSK